LLVTVVITTYNRPRTVRHAIESALNQVYEPVEIILIEDGTDSGVKQWLMTENTLGRVRYERHESNRGLAAARNTGIKLAKGEYVAFLDDDDEWKAEFLTTLFTNMSASNNRTGVTYCGVEVRDCKTSRAISTLYPRNRGDLKTAIMSVGAATLPSSGLFRKSALIDAGGFDEKLSSSVDHDIWMSLAVKGYEAEAVDEALVVSYSSTDGRLTTDMTTRPDGIRAYVEKWKPVYREWFGESEGDEYGRRYFANVVGRLAADKLVYWKISDAWRGIRQVVAYSGMGIALPRFAKYVVMSAGRKILPRSVIKAVKGI
jgi:glycosyltransferase involved in cell wall biosynthesis